MTQLQANTLWMLGSGFLVLLMQAGFCCLESGVVRSKNSINVAAKNIADICITGLLFWFIGFGLMFGPGGNAFIGVGNLFLADATEPWDLAFFFFQVVFCGTATTIISGAVAERIRFSGYAVIAVVVSLLIYPVFGHWAWGGEGASAGWLKNLGFIDFAGSTVVHSVGGWVSLACVLIIGPRIGRFGSGKSIHGHNLPMAALGAFLLFFGWFGFNAGSTLEVNDTIPLIIVNTFLAAVSGGLFALIYDQLTDRRKDVGDLINGLLAGLVGITAGCNIMSPAASVLIGGVSGVIAVLATRALDRVRIDDVVGAVPVHAVAGVWGTLAVALLGNPEAWGGGSRLAQLGVQAAGAGACFVWSFGVAGGLFFLWHRHVMSMRVPEETERLGLNVAEHGAHTPSVELWEEMEAQHGSGDFSRPVHVEMHTEIGLIAAQYNRILEKMNGFYGELQKAGDVAREQTRRATSELRERLQELEVARKAAEEASVTKSRFLANMSHELRTPLNAIIGYSEILLEDIEDKEGETAEDIRKIRTAGRHLLALINDILDISKIEAGKMEVYIETFDVRSLVNDVASTITPLVKEKGNTLEVIAAPGLGQMSSDMTKLRQNLFNLLSNASKFTEKGTIKLHVRRLPATETEPSDRLVFRVIDTGIGMSPEAQSKMFKDFSQADASTTRKYGGTGLGLAITKKFCEFLGGGISFESEEGRGTTFTMILPAEAPDTRKADAPAPVQAPAAAEPDPEPARAEPPLPDPSGGNIVLLIDDDPEVHEMMGRTLKAQGYQPVSSLWGEEGIRLARKLKPVTIILDVIMPGMDGWQVLGILKSDPELRDIPVIMSTVVGERKLGLSLGAAEHMTKPVDKNLLLGAIERMKISNSGAPVLVVEDDKASREILVRFLESQGCGVLQAANGLLAIEQLNRRRPSLILLDLMMPVMDGFQVLWEIQSHPEWKNIPVIVVTAKDLTLEDRRVLSDTAHAIVQKGGLGHDQLVAEIMNNVRKVSGRGNSALSVPPAARPALVSAARVAGAGVTGGRA